MKEKLLNSLKLAYKQENNGKIKERILMMIKLEDGLSCNKTAEFFDCPHSKVLFWKYRFEEEGLTGLQNKPKSGRPRFLSEKQEVVVKKIVLEPPKSKNVLYAGWSTKQVRKLIQEKTGILYSPLQVRKILHRWDYGLITPRPTFWQKASGEEIQRFWKKNPVLQEKIPKT
jgi:transposase